MACDSKSPQILLLLLLSPLEFFTSALADGLLLECEWQLVSRTLLSILAVLNNAVVWMVSTQPPTSKSSSPFNNPLVTVPKAPITIGIIFAFMFHSFFNSLTRSRYLSFSHSISFILWSAATAKSTILQILFFLLIIIRSGLLAEIRWSVCTSKSHSIIFKFWILFSVSYNPSPSLYRRPSMKEGSDYMYSIY